MQLTARQTNKVSKKLKLSKSKLNYHKDERRLIHRHERRQAKTLIVKELSQCN